MCLYLDLGNRTSLSIISQTSFETKFPIVYFIFSVFIRFIAALLLRIIPATKYEILVSKKR